VDSSLYIIIVEYASVSLPEKWKSDCFVRKISNSWINSLICDMCLAWYLVAAEKMLTSLIII
jgi:hypothetical protein